MIKFSESRQAFYETDFDYPDLPGDLVPVATGELHLLLVDKINSGCRVFSDLSFSEPKPTPYCVWEDGAWYDPETEEEKNQRYLASLRPLTRRQFMLVLIEHDLDESIEGLIDSIPDVKTRKQIKVEYKESTTFERLSPSVLQMCDLLQLTEQQINEMWELGLTL
jgi:hypothetical protein